jgi:GntR family transcriptional regulator
MLKINYNSPVPIYEQLVEEIKRLIMIGELKEGDSLPPIRTLAKQLDVDKNTVARAYQELFTQQFIEGNRRKGSFVKNRIPVLNNEDEKIFKQQILRLIQSGMNKDDIEKLFYKNLNQIFD